ncbi:hypothetical protein NM208_g3093 [Fusarium decemcellulare]|uniref:Uncharacterized protein n=1 Tax=Fusarium decemcellulare TaxID=57161 RepID=A0ACC1SQ67_9HYPO|nr:hypothetical protein NM208_g3093 [Fusarium decemcellulare]
MLAARGILLSDADSNGNTCFHQVVFNSKPFTGDHREVLGCLNGSGADMNKPNIFGFTPLCMAYMKEKPDLVKCLLDLGTDINEKATTLGTTALMEACCKSTPKTVEILLENDADMSIKNHHGITALTLSCRYGHLEHVKALVHKCATVTCHDKQGHIPLCAAAFLALHDVVLELSKTLAYYPKSPMQTKSFTKAPADVPKAEEGLLKGLTKSASLTGYALYCHATWLHIAAQHGQTAFIPIVSEAGVSAVAMGKITAMHLAAEEGTIETPKYLLEIIGPQSRGQTALARVAAIVKRNVRDQSPLAISIQQKHKEMTAIFWSEIKRFGTTNKEFLRENPDDASAILEMVAQLEKPRSEETLRHLLREWCSQPPPIKDPEDFTTLETGGVEELIQELLQHPPPIQDHVANPNGDQPPKLPKSADDTDPSLDSYGTIVDIFSDGRVTSIPSS